MLNRTLAPESKPLTHIDIPQMQSIALNNHHKLHFFEAKFTQVLKLELYWQAGTIFETTPQLANFTAKMLTEGTEKYSAQEIISQIDQYGAFIETNGGLERVSITIYTLTKHFEKVLVWVKEIITNSNFPENEWLNLQQITRQNLRINLQKNNYQVGNHFKKIIYGENHPFGKYLTEENLDFINQKHLKDFFEVFIQNKPIEAILVGNFGENGEKNALNIIKSFLEDLPTNTQNIRPKYETETPKAQIFHVEKADALQSSLRMGQVLFSKKHEDYSALMILNEIFGGYFGSRLMKNIREDKGYTYGIHSQFVTLRDMGYWAVSADVKKEFLQNTFSEIDKEADMLKQDLVSDAELQTVKQYMLGAFAGSLNTPFDVAETFKAIYFLDLDYNFYDKYLDTIRNITPSQVRDIAQKYLHTDNWVKVSVG